MFLNDSFPDIPLLTILEEEYFACSEILKYYIKKTDVILLQGGGNFGVEYTNEIILRRDVILNFPDNRIILFPQTIFFPQNDEGCNAQDICHFLYDAKSNLTIFSREKVSFSIMKTLFPNTKVYLLPDMALKINWFKQKQICRKGIGLCLRDDLECLVKKSDVVEILRRSKLEAIWGGIYFLDTMNSEEINDANRNRIVFEKIAQISRYKVLITDRLHGMIFAAISGTPCVVLCNSNHKVHSFYETWLSDLSYIKCVDRIEDIVFTCDFLYSINEVQVCKTFDYSALINALS